MSETICPELCSLIINVSKSPKYFDFSETEKSVSFVWFEKFPWICYSWWEDKASCLLVFSLVIKFGKIFQKTISNMESSSKKKK